MDQLLTDEYVLVAYFLIVLSAMGFALFRIFKAVLHQADRDPVLRHRLPDADYKSRLPRPVPGVERDLSPSGYDPLLSLLVVSALLPSESVQGSAEAAAPEGTG